MSRARRPIVLHLTPAERYRRHRAGRRGVAKTHGHRIGRMTPPGPPPTPARAAAPLGRSAVGARALLKRRNARGPDGRADRRVGTDGGHSELTTDQPIDRWAARPPPPPDGGIGTGPTRRRHVADGFGVAIGKPTAWRWRRGRGFAPPVPRPGHPRAAAAAAQQAGKRPHGPVACRAAAPASRQDGRTPGRG